MSKVYVAETVELRYERGIYSLKIDGADVGRHIASMSIFVPGPMMEPTLTVHMVDISLDGKAGEIKRALLALE